MKLSDEIKRALGILKTEAQALIGNPAAKLEELEAINNKIDLEQKKLETQMRVEAQGGVSGLEGNRIGDDSHIVPEETGAIEAYNSAFKQVIRGNGTKEDIDLLKTEMKNQLGSGDPASGGYLIPVDQDTAIIELKRELTSLRKYVNIEMVRTLSGNRNIEVGAENIPFIEVGEKTSFSDLGNPTFANIAYKIKKLGGFMDIPNELLDDETAGLLAYINKWLAKKEVATENALIIGLMKLATQKSASSIDEVKDILDVELDPLIAASSMIFMNQSSFNAYNKMKDANERPLLETDPKSKTGKMLQGKKIVVLSNRILPNFEVAGRIKAPVGIGNLKDYVTIFDRKARSIETTRIGGTSWDNDTTSMRAIIRMDAQKVDSKAFIMGLLDLSAAPQKQAAATKKGTPEVVVPVPENE